MQVYQLQQQQNFRLIGNIAVNDDGYDNCHDNNSITIKNSLPPPPPPLPQSSSLLSLLFFSSTMKDDFEKATTTIEQEVHRYQISFWTFVRVICLLCFPYIMSYVGESIVWSQLTKIAAAATALTSTSPSLLYQELILLCIVHMIVILSFLLHNAFYGILYRYKIPFFDQYRVDNKPWHWEVDPHNWNIMLLHTIKVVSFNLVCISFTLIVLTVYVSGVGCPYRYDDDTLPSGNEIMYQLFICLLLEDFMFHHSHQLLHTKRFYWIHAVHHKYHIPIGVASAYAHPIEYIIGNILPSVLGPNVVFRKEMHTYTYCIWLVFRLCAAIENHSGYEFPWSMYQAIPLKAPTEYHDYHHHRNRGNYSGVLRIWDCIYGTNIQYFKWIANGRTKSRMVVLQKEE